MLQLSHKLLKIDDQFFEDLSVHPNNRNGNVRTYEEDKIKYIIKRIPKFKNTQNTQQQIHPLNEFNFAIMIQQAQQKNRQSNRQDAENVVTMYHTHETPNYYYIIMEKCDQSLYDEINSLDSKIRGNQQQIVDCLYQICKGYKFLQSISIDFIHRDLTLDNLLIKTVDGRIIVKIADFGISKLDETIIQTSNINKKQHFLAPEFIKYSSKTEGIQKYSNQVDIFSLGICLYFMMFGLKDVPEYTSQKLNLENKDGNKLVNIILVMTEYDYLYRKKWEQLYQDIIQDHLIFHSQDYYKLEIKQQQYDMQTFLKQAHLIIDHYKTIVDRVMVQKPLIGDNQECLVQLKRIDNFIQMVNQDNENEIYLLLELLFAESQRDNQVQMQQTLNGYFQNLELLQIKYYLQSILYIPRKQYEKKATLTQQQQYQLIQDMKGRSSNPEYYNYYINQSLGDVSERTCCLIM